MKITPLHIKDSNQVIASNCVSYLKRFFKFEKFKDDVYKITRKDEDYFTFVTSNGVYHTMLTDYVTINNGYTNSTFFTHYGQDKLSKVDIIHNRYETQILNAQKNLKYLKKYYDSFIPVVTQ